MPETPKIEEVMIRFMSPDTQNDDAKKFLQMMMNRMAVSYHKYGPLSENFPHNAIGVDQIKQRVDKYLETGNTEWLVDAANYCMIEYLYPWKVNAHFRATDSDESPGRINADGTVSHGRN